MKIVRYVNQKALHGQLTTHIIAHETVTHILHNAERRELK